MTAAVCDLALGRRECQRAGGEDLGIGKDQATAAATRADDDLATLGGKIGFDVGDHTADAGRAEARADIDQVARIQLRLHLDVAVGMQVDLVSAERVAADIQRVASP